MGALLPNNKSWGYANWISKGVFDDMLEVIDKHEKFADIREDIQNAIKYHSFTLDYRNADLEKIKRLKQIIDEVYLLNERRGGGHFNIPSSFPAYLDKLKKFQKTLEEF